MPQNIWEVQTHYLASNDSWVKISLLQEGNENIYTPLVIQWIDNNGNISKEEIQNNTPPNAWSLWIKDIQKTSDVISLQLLGTHSYSYENKEFTVRIDEYEAESELFKN